MSVPILLNAMIDREIEFSEIGKCVRKLKNNKAGGSDGLVGELLKYGGRIGCCRCRAQRSAHILTQKHNHKKYIIER